MASIGKLTGMHRLPFALFLAATTAHAAVTGTLIDESGKPVSGATIRAYALEDPAAMAARLRSSTADRPAIATAQSGEKGVFTIDTKAALVELLIESATTRSRSIEGAERQNLHVIVLRPKSAQKFRLMIAGKPVTNASVAAGGFMARSDEEGLVQLPDGSGRIVIWHPDFAPLARFFGTEAPGVQDIALSRGVAVHGRALSADGKPVANATVTVDGWPLAQSATDGTFSMEHAPPAWHRLIVSDATRAGSANNVRAASYDVRLRPAGFISGTTQPGARVSYNGEWGSGLFEFVFADASGKFAFPPLPSGTYTLFAVRPGFTAGRSELLLHEAEHVTRSIRIEPFATVRGRVVDEQKQPVAGAFVWSGWGQPGHQDLVMTEANGEFIIGVGDRARNLFAVKSGYAIGTAVPKDDTTLTLPRGFPLDVHVIDAQRKNVGDATVTVTHGAEGEGPGTRYEAACEQPLVSKCHTTDDAGIVHLRATEALHSITVHGAAIVARYNPPQAMAAKSSPITIEVQRSVEIAGRVMYSDRTPIADSFVATSNFGGGPGASARTEADGSFVLRNLAPGKTTIIANTVGAPRMESGPLEVDAPARGVKLTIPTPARIEGRALDKDTGQPITEFQVVLMSRSDRGFTPGQSQLMHADDGSYVLDGVPPGSVNLDFRAAGYERGSLAGLSTEEGRTLHAPDAHLEKGGSIRGRVTAKGQPVSGVNVQFSDGPPTAARGLNSAISDDSGDYVVEGIGAGDHTIVFQKEGFVTKRKDVDVTKGSEARLDVELDRGNSLLGRVVDKKGQPVAGVAVMARASGVLHPVRTNASGEFTIEALADGLYSIQASKRGYVNTQIADVTVPATAPITLTMDSGGSISGRVTGLSPSELGGADVTVTARGTFARAITNPDGSFVVNGVPDGTVNISAVVRSGLHPRQSVAQSVEVINGTAPPVQIDFTQGITISGRVTKNGSPLTAGSVNFSGKEQRFAAIGPNGTYSAEGLVAGDYRVSVDTPFGPLYQSRYTVTADATYDIQIQGATIHGRVVDAKTGAPLSEAMVTTIGTRDNPVSRQTITDSDGRFALEAVPDGTLDVRASKPERYAPAMQSVTVRGGSTTDVELRLEQAAPMVFRVTDVATGGAIDAMVVVTDANRKPVTQSGGIREDDGGIRVYVGPGQYHATVLARGYSSQSIDFSAPGSDMRVSLQQAGRMIIIGSKPVRVRVVRNETGNRVASVVTATATGSPLESLAPGSYQLDVFAADNKTVVKSIPAIVNPGQTTTVNVD